MEEDIWEIENNIDMFMDTLYENYRQSSVKPFEKAIEHLIARNKELEEENQKLKLNIEFKEKELNNIYDTEEFFIDSMCVPKSKIREKIKELENLFKINVESYTSHEMVYFVRDYIEKLKSVLQELLEGEK